MDSTERIEWVLFDLGGIFVTASADEILAGIAEEFSFSRAELDAAVERYGPAVTRGEWTLLDAYTDLVDRTDADASPCAMLEFHLREFRRLCTEHRPEAVALAARLKSRFHVGCLTNTEREVARICSRTGLFDYFERAFLSVEMGLAKPAPEIYRTVARELGCVPGRIFFTDDRVENVEGARAVGMPAVRWQGAEAFEARLQRAVADS